MKDSILFHIQIVEELLSQMLPMLNKVSSNAFFVQEGRFDGIRPTRQQLEKWCVQYKAILPEQVTSELFAVTHRLNDWIMSNGSSATPHNFATDEHASFHALTQALENCQKQLYGELSEIKPGETKVTIDQSITVGTRLQNVNISGNIQDAFNATVSFGESQPHSELHKRLQELCALVNQMVGQLPEQIAEQVSRDLKTLVTEATTSQPRRKWYELSAEGILEAAKTCAAMVSPVSAAVKGVLGILSTIGV